MPALPADEPLRHFLGDLRALYPAFPTLLHTLLAALSSTADSGAPQPARPPAGLLCALCAAWGLPGLHRIMLATSSVSITADPHPTPLSLCSAAAAAAAAASANAYLAQLSSLVCLHVLPDTGIEEDPNEEGIVYAQQPIPLPGARMLTLPQVRRNGALVPVALGVASQAGSLIDLLLLAALQVPSTAPATARHMAAHGSCTQLRPMCSVLTGWLAGCRARWVR